VQFSVMEIQDRPRPSTHPQITDHKNVEDQN